jgi:dTDP-D-glucose 4,6-dehydratase
MPGGQPRRKLDTERAKNEFGFEASVQFEEGIARTVQWFRDNREWVEGDIARRDASETRAAQRG